MEREVSVFLIIDSRFCQKRIEAFSECDNHVKLNTISCSRNIRKFERITFSIIIRVQPSAITRIRIIIDSFLNFHISNN